MHSKSTLIALNSQLTQTKTHLRLDWSSSLSLRPISFDFIRLSILLISGRIGPSIEFGSILWGSKIGRTCSFDCIRQISILFDSPINRTQSLKLIRRDLIVFDFLSIKLENLTEYHFSVPILSDSLDWMPLSSISEWLYIRPRIPSVFVWERRL